MKDRSWVTKGKCAGEDPLKWDLDIVKMPRTELVGYATDLCKDCPVIAQCAAETLTSKEYGVIRAGRALKSGTRYREYMQHVVIHGEPPEVRVRSYEQKDRERQKKYQLERKIKRWEHHACTLCTAPMKPEGLPDDLWPERVIAANPKVCRSCFDLTNQKREARAMHPLGRWHSRYCHLCGSDLKPASEKGFPERAVAASPRLCVGCAERQIA